MSVKNSLDMILPVSNIRTIPNPAMFEITQDPSTTPAVANKPDVMMILRAESFSYIGPMSKPKKCSNKCHFVKWFYTPLHGGLSGPPLEPEPYMSILTYHDKRE